MKQDKDIKFVISFGDDPKIIDYKKPHHYKACAAYAAKVISDPANYRHAWYGGIMWETKLCIIESNYDVAEMSMSGDLRVYDVISGTDVYPAVMYVFAALRQARDEIMADANRWMTPIEVESELGLSNGVVRQRIHRSREKFEYHNVIHNPDDRTVLIRRGTALAIWGRRGEKVKSIRDRDGYENIFDLTANTTLYESLVIQQPVYEALEALTYTETEYKSLHSDKFEIAPDKYARITKRYTTLYSGHDPIPVYELHVIGDSFLTAKVHNDISGTPHLIFNTYSRRGDAVNILKAIV